MRNYVFMWHVLLKVMSSTWSRHTRPLSPAIGLGSITWASEKGRKVEKAGTFLVLSVRLG